MMQPPSTPPWKRKKKNAGKPKKTMTQAQIAEARARAEAAGRPYPNLIDSMAVMKDAKR